MFYCAQCGNDNQNSHKNIEENDKIKAMVKIE